MRTRRIHHQVRPQIHRQRSLHRLGTQKVVVRRHPLHMRYSTYVRALGENPTKGGRDTETSSEKDLVSS